VTQLCHKVQKHNSFNINTPSSESYRNYVYQLFNNDIYEGVSKIFRTESIKEYTLTTTNTG